MPDPAPPTSIFLTLLGDQSRQLPPLVHRLHALPLPIEFRGRAQATAARGLIATLCARVAGLPAADGEVDARVVFQPRGFGIETWTRHFGRSRFRSTLRAVNGELHEQMGPVRLRFRLIGDAQGIVWQPLGMDVLRIPFPRALLRGIEARESERDGRYRFDVAAVLPVIGLVVRYAGWFEVPDQDPTATTL